MPLLQPLLQPEPHRYFVSHFVVCWAPATRVPRAPAVDPLSRPLDRGLLHSSATLTGIHLEACAPASRAVTLSTAAHDAAHRQHTTQLHLAPALLPSYPPAQSPALPSSAHQAAPLLRHGRCCGLRHLTLELTVRTAYDPAQPLASHTPTNTYTHAHTHTPTHTHRPPWTAPRQRPRPLERRGLRKTRPRHGPAPPTSTCTRPPPWLAPA